MKNIYRSINNLRVDSKTVNDIQSFVLRQVSLRLYTEMLMLDIGVVDRRLVSMALNIKDEIHKKIQ
jgi:hypothetical protein